MASDSEPLTLIAQLTAMLPFVGEERRRRYEAVLRRLRPGVHGVRMGARFEATVRRPTD